MQKHDSTCLCFIHVEVLKYYYSPRHWQLLLMPPPSSLVLVSEIM